MLLDNILECGPELSYRRYVRDVKEKQVRSSLMFREVSEAMGYIASLVCEANEHFRAQ